MTLVEKYRPRTLDDVFGHDEMKELFKSWTDSDDIPHLIIYGYFGTGKSSFVEAGLRDYYGKYYHLNHDTKNASQQSVRGIGAMDEIIKTELNIKPMGDFPFRIKVFEEAEQITEAGQRSLKRAMEEHAHNTRFIFITNYFEKMDEGIRNSGRCVNMKFHVPDRSTIHALLTSIARKEGKIDDEGVKDAIDSISSAPYIVPRIAVRDLGVFFHGGMTGDTVMLRDKCTLIVNRLFSSRKDKVKPSKLYRGLMDIYGTIRPDYSSPERDMVGHIFEVSFDNYFNKHPVIVGELSKSLSVVDIALQDSSNANVHMSSFLWKLSQAFGG